MKEIGNNFKLSLLKEVCIRSLSGPYSVQMPENADQKDFDTSYAVYVFVGNCLQTVIYCLPCSYKTQPKVTQVGWMVSIKLVLLWIGCGACKRSVLQEIEAIHNCLDCNLLSLEKLWIQMHQVATQLTLALIRVRNVKRQCPFEVTFKISHFL